MQPPPSSDLQKKERWLCLVDYSCVVVEVDKRIEQLENYNWSTKEKTENALKSKAMRVLRRHLKRAEKYAAMALSLLHER